uniref:hypothetical protein n=1 Tax=Mucilaginibacter sp. Bleaf8 TaxID=2834430 RepID=UPI001BCD08DE|nr:hypothetical protein [Mucilaginibacter sp. Bleaf8]
MRVFSSKFLEDFATEQILPQDQWNWQPSNSSMKEIYASGSKTGTRQSTYAAEKDNESDSDRPNEGR